MYKVKFHKATTPAFNVGEVWFSPSGNNVEIVSVEKYHGATSDHNSNYVVKYKPDPLNNPEKIDGKDCYSFQLRYTHHSDFI